MNELQKFLKVWFWNKFVETGSISAWINYKEVSSPEYSRFIINSIESNQEPDRENNARN